jgi:hypothetical protein
MKIKCASANKNFSLLSNLLAIKKQGAIVPHMLFWKGGTSLFLIE